MRLLSALMAGLTALFVFLFVRESLPGAPWAWTVGGLCAALAPLLGFTSGAVTPDAMLYAVSAAIFYCLARAFRRGLTRRLAVGLGLLTAIGFLTKLNFIGEAPGVMLGLAILGLRGVREPARAARRQRAFGAMAIAMALAVSPLCAYVLSNLLQHHHLLGLVSSAAHAAGARPESIFGEISYIWQFYLPRLPGMANQFPGLSTIRQVWFDRAVGLYGWLDTTFPVWVYEVAVIPAVLMATLTLRTLLARRRALRGRILELSVYLVMCVGLMTLIGSDSHLSSVERRRRVRAAPLSAAAAAARRRRAHARRAWCRQTLGSGGRRADGHAFPGPRHLQPATRRVALLRLTWSFARKRHPQGRRRLKAGRAREPAQGDARGGAPCSMLALGA